MLYFILSVGFMVTGQVVYMLELRFDPYSFQYISISVIVGVCGAFFFHKAIRLNEKETEEIQDGVILGDSELLLKWEYERRFWKRFARKYRFRELFLSLSKGLGVLSVLLGVGWLLSIEEGDYDLLIGFSYMVLVFGGGVYWGFNKKINRFYKAFRGVASLDIKVYLSGILVNEKYIIPFVRKYERLSQISIEKKFENSCLCFTIDKLMTGRVSYEESVRYYVPIPPNKKIEAECFIDDFNYAVKRMR